jgi:hypothetical protein
VKSHARASSRHTARRWLRGGLAIGALFFAGLAAGDLHATPPVASATPATAALSMRASPVFGTDAATGDGWVELVAYLDDAGTLPVKGSLQIETTYTGFSSDGRFTSRAPFHVEPRSEAVIHLPVRSAAYSGTPVTLSAIGDDGVKLAETTISLGESSAPLLVDVDEPSRLSVVMRGWPVIPGWHASTAPYVAPGSSTPLTVGAPAVDATTGEPVLPERPSGYAAATVVVLPSDRLAGLQGPQLDALVGWLLAGGTIAVFPTRPEDLRGGALTTLVGGAITTTTAPAIMMTLPGAVRGSGPPPILPPPKSPVMPWGPSPTPTPTMTGGGATPIGWFTPVRTTPFVPGAGTGPTPSLRGKLVGFSGGNLVPDGYGASTSYGLGQVHVLGFDPTSSPGLEDPWVHGRLLDMIADAWDRKALRVFPPGSGDRASDPYEVHRALDPNENFRPALGIAAILLVLYSIFAGPVVFMRAHRRGRPLDPLVWVPVASAACFALIMVVGLAGKGWSGRARHLSLVEAGAGMTRGTVRRFRGFFASQTRAMQVRATDPGSVLQVMNVDSRTGTTPVLRIDKQGAALENLTSLPWQTVVVSEDGITDLGGGVAIREKADGSVVVANHTTHELRSAIVWAPKAGATWFQSIPAGDTVLSTSGRSMFSPSGRRVGKSGVRDVHEMDVAHLSAILGRAGDEMTPLWTAMTSASGSSTDWWPDDVPVVVGELKGGEGTKSDGGLRVESDVLLVRIVGEGGAT